MGGGCLSQPVNQTVFAPAAGALRRFWIRWFQADPIPSDLHPAHMRRQILAIVLPAMVELILTQLVSMVDMMMVGQLGSWAIAAVGLTTQPKFLLLMVFIALNSGATAMVARFKGAQDPVMANKTMHQSLSLTLVLAVVVAALGYVFSQWMVRAMGGIAGETLEPATQYLQIQMLGFVPLALTTAITAALRGVGKTKASMYYNLVSNLVNVFFNYCLIYGRLGMPRMELAGASLATVLGQCVAFVIALLLLTAGKHYLKLHFNQILRFDLDLIRRIMRIGMPAMIEQLVMRTGIILYVRLVASLGTELYATHQICMNILSLSFMNGQAFGISATSLMGQSLGRERVDEAKAYVRYTRMLGMIVSTLLGIVLFFCGSWIAALYSNEAHVIEMSGGLLKIVALIQPLQGSQLILSGALRGAGDTRSTAVIGGSTMLGIRPLLGWLLVYPCSLGLWGAWLALATDQSVRSIWTYIRYRKGKWQQIKV
jgi:putative MATE family efflux protein